MVGYASWLLNIYMVMFKLTMLRKKKNVQADSYMYEGLVVQRKQASETYETSYTVDARPFKIKRSEVL